jgi:hypothetical protein
LLTYLYIRPLRDLRLDMENTKALVNPEDKIQTYLRLEREALFTCVAIVFANLISAVFYVVNISSSSIQDWNLALECFIPISPLTISFMLLFTIRRGFKKSKDEKERSKSKRVTKKGRKAKLGDVGLDNNANTQSLKNVLTPLFNESSEKSFSRTMTMPTLTPKDELYPNTGNDSKS